MHFLSFRSHAHGIVAVINLAVVDYLYRKFPDANSDQLSLPRARAVCNQALSALSVKHLQLHKSVLVNNVELSMAINKHVHILEDKPYPEILVKGWKLDPPKVLSDIFESVVGAVFVDTGYDYETTAAVVEQAMEGLLVHLSPAMPRDPVSELIIWVARSTCREQIEFRSVRVPSLLAVRLKALSDGHLRRRRSTRTVLQFTCTVWVPPLYYLLASSLTPLRRCWQDR